MRELREETQANTDYIRSEGYQVVELWECGWRQMKKTSFEVQRFLVRFRRPLDHHRTLTQQQILQAVLDDNLFGVIECDIHIPENLKETFSEMCPIFKNTEISRNDLGEYMKQFAEENELMKQPRRSLIGSFFGEKILLATPLLKWYLQDGLEVTRCIALRYLGYLCFLF